MTEMFQLFQHSFSSAWLVLATDEVLRPPFMFDLSLQLAGLFDESSPVVVVLGPESDNDELTPLLDQLADTLATESISFIDLDGFNLKQSNGRVGGLILYGGSPRDWVQEAGRFLIDDQTPSSPRVDIALVIGAPCAAVGEWTVPPSSPDTIEGGLGWLPHGIVIPGLAHPVDIPVVRDLLAHQQGSFAIGLPPGGIIALGPSGELEIWSEVNPGIILGKGWGQS